MKEIRNQKENYHRYLALVASMKNQHNIHIDKRVPTDDNYQSLNVEGYHQLQIDPNENIPQYTSLKSDNNLANNDGIPGESVYEELP